jgi:hypothetical protein
MQPYLEVTNSETGVSRASRLSQNPTPVSETDRQEIAAFASLRSAGDEYG